MKQEILKRQKEEWYQGPEDDQLTAETESPIENFRIFSTRLT